MKAGMLSIAIPVLLLSGMAFGTRAAAGDVVADGSGPIRDTVVTSDAPGWTWDGMMSYDDPAFKSGTGYAGGSGGSGIYTFQGSGVDVYVMAGPVVSEHGISHRAGKLDVSIDGDFKAEFNVKQDEQDYDVHAFTIRGLGAGNHVLQLEPVDGWVAIDYITVHTEPMPVGVPTSEPTAKPVSDDQQRPDQPDTDGSGFPLSTMIHTAAPVVAPAPAAPQPKAGDSSDQAAAALNGKTINLITNNATYVDTETYGLGADQLSGGTAKSAFEVIYVGYGFVALKSTSNNNYVCVSPSQSLFANKAVPDSSPSSCELFHYEPQGDGSVAFRALVNGQYVTVTRSASTDILAASRDSVNLMEKFKVVLR